jgi:hypothetical protein
MKASRDRDKKRAGKKPRPEGISNSELASRVGEFCQLVRQQNKELSALLRQRQQAVLTKVPTGAIQ